jgi:hypothetical protein
MSSPLETQVKAWVDTISSQETISAYRSVLQTFFTAVTALWDALKVSWEIIKETGKLIWLFICFGLVASDWLWDSGKKVVTQVQNVTAQSGNPKSDTYVMDTGKAFFEASKSSVVKAVSQAREQLNLPKNGVANATPAPTVAPTAAPTAAPVTKTETSQPETPTEET